VAPPCTGIEEEPPSGAVPFDLSTWVQQVTERPRLIGVPTVQTEFQPSWLSLHPQSILETNKVKACRPIAKEGMSTAPLLRSAMDRILTRSIRQVGRWCISLFDLQNGKLNPLVGHGKTPPPVEIELWEAQATTSFATICSWQTDNPDTICKSPNTTNNDSFGQFTDHMNALVIPYSVQMQFLVDRQGCRSSGQIRMVVGMGHGDLLPRPRPRPAFTPTRRRATRADGER